MNPNYLLLYSAALFSFFLPAFWKLVPFLAGPSVRWISLVVVGVATAFVVVHRAVSLPRLLFFSLLSLWMYALLTATWSQNPNLTIAKWAVFVMASAVFLYGGVAIGRTRAMANPFTPIAPLLFAGIGASLLAVALNPSGSYVSGLFQGHVDGPNMLGTTLALSTPWLILELHRVWHQPGKRAALIGLICVGATFLLMSRSRGAMLFTLVLLTVGILALPTTRRTITVLCAVMLLLSSYVMFPDFFATTAQTYVYKSSARVFETREDTFDLSLERAREGGNFGIGYGISSGESWEWNWELTSVGFGREKGSSQLALLEEMGVVGLVLYGLLLGGIFLVLVFEGRRARRVEGATLLYYVMIGFVIASVAHSTFEAWFTSPGSPEACVFWAVVGLGIGALQARGFQPGAMLVFH